MIEPCPSHILRAYKNGDFTDLTITCGSYTFQVHSLVLVTACEFFARSLKFGGKESADRVINLPDDDPEMIRRLIAYVYLGDYDPSGETGIKVFGNIKEHISTTAAAPDYHLRKGTSPDRLDDRCACLALNLNQIKQCVRNPESSKNATASGKFQKQEHSIEVANPLTIHATMYAIADKYQVEGLALVAQTKFECSLSAHFNSPDFVTAVQLAYSNTPESNRGLRDAVLRAFSVYFGFKITDIPGLEAKLSAIDELSFLLIKSWPNKVEPAKKLFDSGAASGTRF